MVDFDDSSLGAEADIGEVILTHHEAAQVVEDVGAVALPPVGHHLGSFLSHGSVQTGGSDRGHHSDINNNERENQMLTDKAGPK